MAAPSLPEGESLRNKAVSAAAALMIAFSPLQAMAAETAAVQDLSPAEMLVQKTTDSQVSRCIYKAIVVLAQGRRQQASGRLLTQ